MALLPCLCYNILMSDATQESVLHNIAPVWNEASEILILGTMPSPASRRAGFFYMHPQNRFWRVLPAVFGERMEHENNAPQRAAAIAERRDFLLRHHIALWDVLSSCDIHGASDATIRNAVPNDFRKIFERAEISRVFCTGKSAFSLWQKFCAGEYEAKFSVGSECLPSTSPANAAWTTEKLIAAYALVRQSLHCAHATAISGEMRQPILIG